MTKFLIAVSIAIAAMSSSYGAAHAQSIVISNDDGPDYYHPRHHSGYGDRREDDGYGERRSDRGWQAVGTGRIFSMHVA